MSGHIGRYHRATSTQSRHAASRHSILAHRPHHGQAFTRDDGARSSFSRRAKLSPAQPICYLQLIFLMHHYILKHARIGHRHRARGALKVASSSTRQGVETSCPMMFQARSCAAAPDDRCWRAHRYFFHFIVVGAARHAPRSQFPA